MREKQPNKRQSVGLDKKVVQNVLKPLKKQWRMKSYSKVIERLYYEYKIWQP